MFDLVIAIIPTIDKHASDMSEKAQNIYFSQRSEIFYITLFRRVWGSDILPPNVDWIDENVLFVKIEFFVKGTQILWTVNKIYSINAFKKIANLKNESNNWS